MRRLFAFVFTLILTVVTMSAARVYSFSSVGTDMGLSSNCVKSILQDSYGFLWFGTKNGLNRYDGKVVQSYSCYDYEAGRGNNNVSALYEDSGRNLWVGTDRGIYIFDPRTEKFRYVNIASEADGKLPDDWVQDICGDRHGNIWVLIPPQGLFRFYDDGTKVEFYSMASDTGEIFSQESILCTSDGDVFVGTHHGGLFRYNALTGKFRPILNDSPGGRKVKDNTLQFIRQDSRGNLLLFSQSGDIVRYNIGSGEMVPMPFSGSGKVYLRAAMTFDGEIWIGTQKGLYIIDETTLKEHYITDKSPNVNGLTDNLIYTIYRDKDNNAWIGSMFGGVNYFQREGFVFEKFMSHLDPSTLSSGRIRGVAAGTDSLIYIGTEDGGINIFNPSTGKVRRGLPGAYEYSTSVVMRSFGDQVYSGLSRGGLNVITAGTDKVVNIAGTITGNASSVYAVLVDRNGDLWLGCDWGLFRRRKGQADFEQIMELDRNWVFDLFEDSKGRIWVSAMGDGVWVIENGKFKRYRYDEAYSNGLRSNSISSVFEDSSGRIWVSTDRGGLALYQPDTDDFRTYGIDEGLPDNVVYDILEDQLGFLWFGTNKGLVKFNPETGAVKVFTTDDGLSNNQFNYHSVALGLDGNFYFGSIDGLIAFNPQLDRGYDAAPPIYFTRMRIGSGVDDGSDDDLLFEQPLMYTDNVVIPYDARYITFFTASPNYGNTGTLRCSYRLLPQSDEWNVVGADRKISFDRLMPGEYTLEIMVEGDGKVSMNSIRVRVLHPWYNTWWAWLIYIVVVACVAYLLYYFWKKRRDEVQREKEYVSKMQAAKELYENKVQFFSEIAHEIRTPLTLIDSPLEAIEEIGVTDPRIDKYFKVIRKNTSRLLDLVTQLLDFHKLGNSRKKLSFEYVNVSALLNDVIVRFQDAITLKNKALTVSLPDEPVQAMIDKEAVTKIISNLLNNARKYANHDINVTLTSDEKTFTIRVRSDGNKISGEDVYSIFTPFYQMRDHENVGGVGIGLPMSRMLASLHNGTVELEIDDSPENTFRLTLPLRQEGVETPINNANQVLTEYVMDEEPQSSAMTGNSLLLVEDNEEMRVFLHEQMSRYFVVETAENGVEALKLLRDNSYDIIVTDIMMPEMDGYELCRAVKEDVELSHIPIVFLTAKNDLDSKVKALQCGGEAYIEKPFSIKYFRQQVISLLENRRHERRSLIKKPFFSVDNMKMSKADEEFMNKVVQTIQEHISDENFNVELMADVLCMSRSSLLRKIKSLFNLSPIELIRLVKLKKAAELIKDGKYRIGDICFMVGINSSSYFSKLFLKQFGMTPKAFEMQCQKNARSENHDIDINNL